MVIIDPTDVGYFFSIVFYHHFPRNQLIICIKFWPLDIKIPIIIAYTLLSYWVFLDKVGIGDQGYH